jgi:DNA-binding GntR family transcriptional regulator
MSDDRIIGVAAPLRKEVVRRIHDAIISFEFRPGDRLVEATLCDKYGVSRTVIREALRQLEALGVVKNVPNRGPIVASVSRSESEALCEVRVVLMGLAGRLFAERASESDCERLVSALRDLEAVMGTGAPAVILPAKDAFYGVLLEGGRNEVLKKMHDDVLSKIVLATNAHLNVQHSSRRQPLRVERETRKELRAIVKAAAVDRDAERAERCCLIHIQHATEAGLAMMPVDDDEAGAAVSRVV